MAARLARVYSVSNSHVLIAGIVCHEFTSFDKVIMLEPKNITCINNGRLMGVYKQWNELLEWWNTGMVEWNFFKVQYHFVHPNMYNSSS